MTRTARLTGPQVEAVLHAIGRAEDDWEAESDDGWLAPPVRLDVLRRASAALHTLSPEGGCVARSDETQQPETVTVNADDLLWVLGIAEQHGYSERARVVRLAAALAAKPLSGVAP